MVDWSSRVQEFVDGIGASVAVVGRNEAGQLVVPACNDGFFQMTGGRRPGVRAFPIPLDTLVPNYARHEFREKLLECFESGIAQELEQAYDLKDGTHWWRMSLKPFRHTDSGSTVVEILVTGLDITSKMDLTRALEASTSRFRSVVDAAYDAIITIDQHHHITLFNRAAENLFGYSSEEMLGEPIERLLPEKYRPYHARYVQQFARSPVRSRQMDERNRVYGQHRDGSLLPVEIAISKIVVDGLIEFTAVIRDITDRVRLMDLLQKQAVTDELTGLPNRREFLGVVEHILESDDELSVFLLDIDFFKKINDSYGHDVGDEVLRILAKVGMASSRKSDVFARWGGEEFVAALPQTGADDALAIAEQLRATFEQQDFAHEWRTGNAVPFTVTIGVTTRAPGERDVNAILKRADQALYRAKQSGRNRVEAG
ncbi:sensor domain-containing diguanylate cyclase [Paraburkholderia caballeronis]|uniref:diguanylate cyclase n=1 Tax=Paraburkholderia caballeronis TaxID=416943 RepID=A0A1H7EY65_9BURK|nr:diguanylate cyclase [Paraburkholderia caballeronis]PXW23854.1 PAS domain S-box-containing protein/diguanylate cyclase (GGDEF)-like protein [Paraburkholderia caballeronis]PXW99618.1 PAS domain S-box-containing protein/diguanylate cyclase (GGDEF)-like protein [Paraburkholderia caballeronis]RAJ96572.1 PAS domain S-box-containing protein/diguanylate cyclase (GGDEF)-like protein [Paraburkholderia caballeronis]TDV15556.1 PAS domain S-box-containing protein/diguanylate cyclase (GGDEF)-like protein 